MKYFVGLLCITCVVQGLCITTQGNRIAALEQHAKSVKSDLELIDEGMNQNAVSSARMKGQFNELLEILSKK